MKFRNLNNDVINVKCDCGCEDLHKLSLEQVKEIYGFVGLNKEYSCVKCNQLFSFPLSWVEE